jgi:hypothetical protein
MSARDKWELINPGGTVQLEAISARPLPKSLDGKTVLLRWNGKHNGDLFLDRIGELLTENVKDVTVVKAWETFPETGIITSNAERSKAFAKQFVDLKPDISIGTNGD